jgi:cytochrome c
MDAFKHIVLPPSPEHITLLHVILFLSYSIFIPYLSLLFGSTGLSYIFHRIAAKNSDAKYARLAIEVFDTIVVNRIVVLILGVVPFITLILLYAQFLQLEGIIVVDVFILAFVLFIFAVPVLWMYKGNTRKSAYALSAAALLLFSNLLVNAGAFLATNPDSWLSVKTLFKLLLQWPVWFRTFLFIAVSVTLTSGSMLFFLFDWQGGRLSDDGEYAAFARKLFVGMGVISLFTLPLFQILEIFAAPRGALLGALFYPSFVNVLLFFFAAQSLYFMWERFKPKYTRILFYTLIGFVIVANVRETLSYSVATEKEGKALADTYKRTQEATLAKLTGAAAPISGEDVYKNRCASCHRFDIKLVGPPYKQTMPKYEGKESELVRFILNPVKKNPDYPPMPNPGLKPNEAEAVAKYILSAYKEK